jgi:hypothetical protein
MQFLYPCRRKATDSLGAHEVFLVHGAACTASNNSRNAKRVFIKFDFEEFYSNLPTNFSFVLNRTTITDTLHDGIGLDASVCPS